MEAMRLVKGWLPPLGRDRESRRYVALCVQLATYLTKAWEDEPFEGFRAGEAEAFYALFEEENRQVAQRYLGKADGQLFLSRPSHKAVANTPVLTDADRDYLRALFQEGLDAMAISEASKRPLASVWNKGSAS